MKIPKIPNWFLNEFKEDPLRLTSIGIILAYLGFVFATVGLANSSRNRYEDMVLALEQGASPTAAKARDQAELDFHNWYGSMLFISSIAGVLGFCMIVTRIVRRCCGPKPPCPRGIVNLVLYGLAVGVGHVFTAGTYCEEVALIFVRQDRYWLWFPLDWVYRQSPW